MCFTGSQIKPALKGEVGFALAKAGGVEKESRFAWYRQPLSQTFGLPAPRPGSLNSLSEGAFGVLYKLSC